MSLTSAPRLDQRGISSRHRAQHVVNYAKATRHNILKYLAILRWKQAVDIPFEASPSQTSIQATQSQTYISVLNGVAQFPTPLSNDQSPAAGAYIGKGKARAVELHLGLDAVNGEALQRRGKVTDAKRVTVFMEHQNRQHDEAVGHLKFQASVLESFR
jgi:mediator of RNA polymerase II transcription subunit 14